MSTTPRKWPNVYFTCACLLIMMALGMSRYMPDYWLTPWVWWTAFVNVCLDMISYLTRPLRRRSW